MADCEQCEQLKDELTEIKKELSDANDMLEAIATYAATAAQAAANEMRGDVPQGRYAYLKAELDTGNVILNMMNIPPVTLKPKRKRGMFAGLFGG